MRATRAALFALVSAAALFAQTPTAVVNGTVVDTSGAVIPDARVTVVNQETNIASQKSSAADGTFAIINLLPGNYVMTVEKGGFKKVALPVFKLDVNQTLTEKIALEVGSASETVTVTRTLWAFCCSGRARNWARPSTNSFYTNCRSMGATSPNYCCYSPA